jgi:hypothetical protein
MKNYQRLTQMFVSVPSTVLGSGEAEVRKMKNLGVCHERQAQAKIV